jgi:hypothetical protein
MQIPNLIKICLNCDPQRWLPDLMEYLTRDNYKCQAFFGESTNSSNVISLSRHCGAQLTTDNRRQFRLSVVGRRLGSGKLRHALQLAGRAACLRLHRPVSA